MIIVDLLDIQAYKKASEAKEELSSWQYERR